LGIIISKSLSDEKVIIGTVYATTSSCQAHNLTTHKGKVYSVSQLVYREIFRDEYYPSRIFCGQALFKQ